MGKNVHVVPFGNRWATKLEGNPNPLSIHNTQSQAIHAGKPTAQLNRSELVIHRPDGKIRDKDSYGPDPYPPKDTKH